MELTNSDYIPKHSGCHCWIFCQRLTPLFRHSVSLMVFLWKNWLMNSQLTTGIWQTQCFDQRNRNQFSLRSAPYCGKASFVCVCPPFCRSLWGNHRRPTHQARVCSIVQCNNLFSWKSGKSTIFQSRSILFSSDLFGSATLHRNSSFSFSSASSRLW